MLSEQDYRGYLDEMFELEQSMFARYRDIADLMSPGEGKETVLSIMRDEARHMALVQEIKRLVES